MGLDMYLQGSKIRKRPDIASGKHKSPLQQEICELGYWRKHPDLHGYIVQTFAEGRDECQQIYLWAEDMEQIIAAIKANDLPQTEGFFFGESTNDDPQKSEAIQIFEEAIRWLSTPDDDYYRTIIYQASW